MVYHDLMFSLFRYEANIWKMGKNRLYKLVYFDPLKFWAAYNLIFWLTFTFAQKLCHYYIKISPNVAIVKEKQEQEVKKAIESFPRSKLRRANTEEKISLPSSEGSLTLKHAVLWASLTHFFLWGKNLLRSVIQMYRYL